MALLATYSDQELQDMAPYYGNYVAQPRYAFGDWITGRWSSKLQDAQQRALDMKFEKEQLASARQYESLEFDRSIAALKRNGINPYWLNGASSAGSVVSSSSSSRNEAPSRGTSAQGNNFASSIVALLGLVTSAIASKGISLVGNAASNATKVKVAKIPKTIYKYSLHR